MARQVTLSPEPDFTTPADMAKLGAAVRYRRTSLGLTLENAAGLCGLSKQAYNNVELGVESVKVATLFKVLIALGIDIYIDDQQGTTDEWS